jgi:microcystin degradation protein MlrC
MAKQADLLILYKTIPHVDMYERAVEAAELTAKSVSKEISPVMALTKPPMTTVKQGSANNPTREFMARLAALEKMPKILSASMSMGFNYADVPEAGAGFLVITDGDASLAKQEADALALSAWERRHEFVPNIPDIAEAVEQAIALGRDGHPVIIADGSDNPGGGPAGDSVAILSEFMKRGVTGVVVSTVRDPEMVALAHQAGVGAVVKAELGGKTDAFHGPSLPVEARVRLLSDGRYLFKGRMNTGTEGNLGRTAVLEVAGNLVIVNENRQQTLDPELMRRQGIEPRDFRFVVLKSTMHYRSNFTELAHAIVEANGPGLSSARLEDFPRKKMRRPIFPLDDGFAWEP